MRVLEAYGVPDLVQQGEEILRAGGPALDVYKRQAIKCWYQKKCANALAVVAIKAVAHKLARACWHVMKDGKPFEVTRAFG